MSTRHPKYLLKKEDTLQSITQLFAIEESVWKKYHNNICGLDHIIHNKIPKHVKEIFLLPELWSKEAEVNNIVEKKAKLQTKEIQSSRILDLNIYPQISKLSQNYWFRYILKTNEGQTDIYHKMKIVFSHRESNSNSVYIIDKISDTYINGKLPNLCMEELAHETGKVFYPIIIELGKNFQLDSIRNHEEIKARWKNSILPHVSLRYSGEIVQKYLSKMALVIESKNQLEELFRKDLFIQNLFNVYYGDMSQYKKLSTVNFPLGKFTTIPFSINSELDEYLTTKGDIRITQEGVKLRKVSLSQANFVEDDSIRYQSSALLDKNTKLLKESVSEWNFSDEEKIIKLIIRKAQE